MAEDPGIGYRVIATVTDVKGDCSAGDQRFLTGNKTTWSKMACRSNTEELPPKWPD